MLIKDLLKKFAVFIGTQEGCVIGEGDIGRVFPFKADDRRLADLIRDFLLTDQSVIVPMSVLGQSIEVLRLRGHDTLADDIQFGREGIDEGDGSRCQLCGTLQGGDRRHKCW